MSENQRPQLEANLRIHVKRVIDAMGFQFQLYILVPGRRLVDGVGSRGQRHQVVRASRLLPVVPGLHKAAA